MWTNKIRWKKKIYIEMTNLYKVLQENWFRQFCNHLKLDNRQFKDEKENLGKIPGIRNVPDGKVGASIAWVYYLVIARIWQEMAVIAHVRKGHCHS